MLALPTRRMASSLAAQLAAAERTAWRWKPYASYADTYENYVQQIVPALTLAMQQSERAAVFIGPTFTNCRSLTRWAACIALLRLRATSGGLRTSCRCFCTAPTGLAERRQAADRACKQQRQPRKTATPYQSPWVGCDGWLH